MYQAKRGARRWWSSPASPASATTPWTPRWRPTWSRMAAPGHQVGHAGRRSEFAAAGAAAGHQDRRHAADGACLRRPAGGRSRRARTTSRSCPRRCPMTRSVPDAGADRRRPPACSPRRARPMIIMGDGIAHLGRAGRAGPRRRAARRGRLGRELVGSQHRRTAPAVPGAAGPHVRPAQHGDHRRRPMPC